VVRVFAEGHVQMPVVAFDHPMAADCPCDLIDV
jgi:hypothetical protein